MLINVFLRSFAAPPCKLPEPENKETVVKAISAVVEVTRFSSALLEAAFSRTRAPLRQVLRRVVEEPTKRLIFLPDYIVGEHTCWVDDEGEFSTEGGVKTTTVLCDSSATSGAVLFDAA